MRFARALAAALVIFTYPLHAQPKPERFWLAGRYDGDRVVIYFDAVKFKGTMAAQARKIAEPVAEGFFDPVELPASFISRFQSSPEVEQFALGDLYDLMNGQGTVATVRLTTLIGCETDEEVGNDSYIGALATVDPRMSNPLFSTRNFYAVRRHQESRPAIPSHVFAELRDDPIAPDLYTPIAALLSTRMKTQAIPSLKVQAFRLASGERRYYARAWWKPGKVLGAWISLSPTLRILAVEDALPSFNRPPEYQLPELRNVVDLGAGRTGIIIHRSSGETVELLLAEYRDGLNVRHMTVHQSISSGE